MRHLKEFTKNSVLIDQLGEGNAHLAWFMALYLDSDDVHSLATDSITDGSDDKKIDFINLSDGRIVIAQGYYSKKMKINAPTNKASDLNTAFAWLHSGDINKVPENLRTQISDCRRAIENDEINSIEFIYAHNLSESKAVKYELDTLVGIANTVYDNKEIEVSAHEFGIEKIERLFITKKSQIAVKDEVTIQCESNIEEVGLDWKAVMFSATGKWIKELYRTYDTDLYSANYRGFLGLKRKKINAKIRATAETRANSFWAFNNGITMLTTKIKERTNKKIIIDGVSIINGAQTSGSICSISTENEGVLDDVKVMCRIIECSDPDLIPDIIKFNNTQNAITSWDTYSNSEEQKRIKSEFDKMGKEYSMKKGFDGSDIELGISSVAQPCLALRGNYRDANRGKNYIFDNNSTYNSVFEGKSAKHLLFGYTMSKAIEKKKSVLRAKNSFGELNKNDAKQYEYFNSLSFKHFFTAIIGKCLEAIISRPIDLDFICFDKETSEKDINDIIALWTPIVNIVLTAFTRTMESKELGDVIATKEQFLDVAKDSVALVDMSRDMNPEIFQNFASLVIAKQMND